MALKKNNVAKNKEVSTKKNNISNKNKIVSTADNSSGADIVVRSESGKKLRVEAKDRTLQILTHAIGIIAYIFGALFIYILTKDLDVKRHARNALNWQISLAIYNVALLTLSSISALIMAVTQGVYILFPFSLALGVLAILNMIFSIVAAIKANEGELWVYPLSINFIERIGERDIDRGIRRGKREVNKVIRNLKKEFK
ncbi:MAG: DUF4870 domain-containing protein [Candidatus Woesearchaeota archaeon]